jgi:ketosteroid isomerase-like protein
MRKGEAAHLALIRRYFDAMVRGPAGVDLSDFFTADAMQEEFPNRFVPTGTRRDLQGMKEAARRGANVMASQEFELLDAVAMGNKVAAEARWSGTLATQAGPVAAGTVMRARFAMFFEMRDGKIAVQRNYDCFDPW